mmetsp:Transcript_20871/g.30674  ORF Transcript_20871/g.30674 Transcript_20871/m.30674 type:complete len:285 (-) Transcript_20871:650-1504(-)
MQMKNLCTPRLSIGLILFVLRFCFHPTVVTCWSFSSLNPSKTEKSSLNRRDVLSTIASTAAILSQIDNSNAINLDTKPTLAKEYYLPVATNPSAGQYSFPALTPPFNKRATFRYTLGRNAWAFEQLLTFANVTATIRTNVIQMETGGLWVHSPQWPTGEFCALLDDLNAPVDHIVLPCNAFEHKAPMQAFCKKYPKAKVWVSPGQFGPLGSCGTSLQDKISLGYRVDGILGSDVPPWANEFDIATLYIKIPKNAGPVSEIAFCHRPTKTLVATDAVVYVPSGDA